MRHLKHSMICICFLILLTLVSAEQDLAEEETKAVEKSAEEEAKALEKKEAETCARERRRGLRALEKTLTACQEEAKEDPSKATSDCVAKCIMKAEKALNENDLVTEETLLAAMGSRVTGDVRREKLTSHFRQCVNEYGKAEQLGGEEDSCKGFETLGLCLRAAVMDLCDDKTARAKEEL